MIVACLAPAPLSGPHQDGGLEEREDMEETDTAKAMLGIDAELPMVAKTNAVICLDVIAQPVIKAQEVSEETPEDKDVIAALLQVRKYGNMQVCKYAHICKYANMKVCTYMQVCKHASMQVCMYAIVQVY